MNPKFSIVLLVIAIFIAACAPVVAGRSAPMDPAQPAGNDTSALVPVTGQSASIAAGSDSQESRLWSGAISLSDTGDPDSIQTIQVPVKQNLQSECASEDSLPKRQSGCTE